MILDGQFQGKYISGTRLMYPGQYGYAGGLGTVGTLTTWFRDELGYQELEAQKLVVITPSALLPNCRANLL